MNEQTRTAAAAIIGSAAPDTKASCHGCDDCGDDVAPSRTAPPPAAPLPPGSFRVH